MIALKNIVIAVIHGASAAVASIYITLWLEGKFGWRAADILSIGSPIWIPFLIGTCIFIFSLKQRLFRRLADLKNNQFTQSKSTLRTRKEITFSIILPGIVLVASSEGVSAWFYAGCLLILVGIGYWIISYVNQRKHQVDGVSTKGDCNQ